MNKKQEYKLALQRLKIEEKKMKLEKKLEAKQWNANWKEEHKVKPLKTKLRVKLGRAPPLI